MVGQVLLGYSSMKILSSCSRMERWVLCSTADVADRAVAMLDLALAPIDVFQTVGFWHIFEDDGN